MPPTEEFCPFTDSSGVLHEQFLRQPLTQQQMSAMLAMNATGYAPDARSSNVADPLTEAKAFRIATESAQRAACLAQINSMNATRYLSYVAGQGAFGPAYYPYAPALHFASAPTPPTSSASSDGTQAVDSPSEPAAINPVGAYGLGYPAVLPSFARSRNSSSIPSRITTPALVSRRPRLTTLVSHLLMLRTM